MNTMRTNAEIIKELASQKGFIYTGDNLYTYAEWLQKGYAVVRGQKAFIKTRLESKGKNRRLIPAALFTREQVVKINNNSLIVV